MGNNNKKKSSGLSPLKSSLLKCAVPPVESRYRRQCERNKSVITKRAEFAIEFGTRTQSFAKKARLVFFDQVNSDTGSKAARIADGHSMRWVLKREQREKLVPGPNFSDCTCSKHRRLTMAASTALDLWGRASVASSSPEDTFTRVKDWPEPPSCRQLVEPRNTHTHDQTVSISIITCIPATV